ncbi:MAG: 3-phosphoshikimate 1-carboxyvinyltransferase [Synergistaceae bacterium]|nr:3-phosphoshikimate 1-carboxyvinyltransferase [Synergistaceae bacterium]
MNVQICPHRLSGFVNAPVSKSEAHRMLICAALCEEPVKLFIGRDLTSGLSDDITATINCLRSLGAKISFTNDNFLNIVPINRKRVPEKVELDCRESGSTLRFILPVAAALCENVSVSGRGRLPERPVVELIEAMKAGGVKFSSERLPFETSGKLQAGIFKLPGNVSSQYISGLMLALPILKDNSVIKLTSDLKSSAYVDITISSLKKFGIVIEALNNEYKIIGGLKFLSPGAISAGGDWSGAAFFLVAGAFSGPVSVTGLSTSSAQGDKKILDILRDFGAEIKIFNNIITVFPVPEAKTNRYFEIDIDPTPDLLPALAVAAACCCCDVRFYNAARLRLKESDRIKTTASILRSLGGTVTEKPDELLVGGSYSLTGGKAEGFNDHRIVMSAAVAGIKCKTGIIITDAESVGKSYPEFFRDYKSLGGQLNVI